MQVLPTTISLKDWDMGSKQKCRTLSLFRWYLFINVGEVVSEYGETFKSPLQTSFQTKHMRRTRLRLGRPRGSKLFGIQMHSTRIFGRNCKTLPFSGKTLFGDWQLMVLVTLARTCGILGGVDFWDNFIPIAFVCGSGKCNGRFRCYIEAKIRILPSTQIGMGDKNCHSAKLMRKGFTQIYGLEHREEWQKR